MNKKKVISLQNGVDPDLFSKNIDKNPGQIIFVGNLTRFNQNRNLEFIIDCFKNTNLNKKYFLKIIGGPSSEVNRLKEYVKEIGLEERVFIEDRKDRKLAILEIQKSQFGLLINSSKGLSSNLGGLTGFLGEMGCSLLELASLAGFEFSINLL